MWLQISPIILLFFSRCPIALASEAELRLTEALAEPVGELRLSSTVLDRGTVQQGETIFFEFPYKLEGKGPVKILGIHQDCGCLIPSLRAGSLLAENSSGVIRVQADTAQFVGKFDKRITFFTNESEKSAYSLRILANVEPTLHWTPAFVELKSRRDGKEGFQKVRVRSLSKQRIHIEKVNYNEDNLEVAVLPVGDESELQVRWIGERPPKPGLETLEVITDGTVKSFRIPVVEQKPISQAKSF